MKKTILFIILFTLLKTQLSYSLTPQPSQLWGTTTFGGTNDAGTIFAMNLDGSGHTIYYSFNTSTGKIPRCNLTRANNNVLYGTTKFGGSTNNGVLFSFDPFTNTYTNRVNFIGTNGILPECTMLLANDGNLYGTTQVGGAHNKGVLFRFNPTNNVFAVLINFGPNATDPKFPLGTLMQSSNGLIYGTTQDGGINDNGTIFSFNTSNNQLLVVNQCPYPPSDKLLEASNGLFYGTSYNADKIFSFDPGNSSFLTLGSLDGRQGFYGGSLVEISNGKLYGLLLFGGPTGEGSIFSLTLSNNQVNNLEFEFPNSGVNGTSPEGHLTKASNGKLYGTTYNSLSLAGTVFSFEPLNNNTFTKLHEFIGGAYDGKNPEADVVEITPPPCNAVPAKPTTILADVPGGVCPDDVRIYQVTPVSGVIFDWVPPTGATILNGQGTARVTVFYGANFTSASSLSVKSRNSCGINNTSTSLSITLNYPAVPGVIVPNITGGVCPGDVRTYTVPSITGIDYNWTLPTGTTLLSGQGTNQLRLSFQNTFPSSAPISVTASNHCSTNLTPRTLTINRGSFPAMPGTITPNITGKVCPGDVRTYSVPLVAGLQYSWVISPFAGTISGALNSNIVTVTFSSGLIQTQTLAVKASNSCGTSASRNINILRDEPIMPGTISQSPGGSVCPGDVRTYSVPSVPGVNYSWVINPFVGTISGALNSNTVTVTFSNGLTQSQTLAVKATNSCGTSAARNLTISSTNALPPGTITQSPVGSVCPGDARTFSVSFVPGITYHWWVDVGTPGVLISGGQSNTSLTGLNANSITINFTSAFTASWVWLNVTATNSCGTSNESHICINRQNNPGVPGAITGPVNVTCGGISHTYSIAAVPLATSYTWIGPAGSNAIGSSNNVLTTTSTFATFMFGLSTNPTQLRVRANSPCGSSLTRTKILTPGVFCSPLRLANNRSTEEIIAPQEAVLFPNPANSEITLRFFSDQEQLCELIIIDNTGRQVLYKSITASEDVNEHTLDVKNFSAGIYFLKLKIGGEEVNRKFVKN